MQPTDRSEALVALLVPARLLQQVDDTLNEGGLWLAPLPPEAPGAMQEYLVTTSPQGIITTRSDSAGPGVRCSGG